MTEHPTTFDLKEKLALVTGAGSGLGLEFSRGLAAFGAEVVCADLDSQWSEAVAGRIRDSGGRASSAQVDVSDPDSVQRLSDRVAQAHGRIDILFNNAGIASMPKRVHELSIEEWDRLIAIDLRGVFLCTRAILPIMLSGGGGSIVNIASIIGVVGHYPGFAMVGASYAAAKAGIIGFTRQVAVEYAKDNIRANVIAPGWHGGTRLASRFRDAAPAEAIARYESAIVAGTPMGRRGRPEELVGLAVYLASDASRFVTGQVVAHDGGWTAA